MLFICLFKQKTAYEMRISDWSSDVCSSDLHHDEHGEQLAAGAHQDDVAEAGGGQRGHGVVERVDVVLDLRIGVHLEHVDQRRHHEDEHHQADDAGEEIGRAPCWESVCQYV